jgi:hypothetical protein
MSPSSPVRVTALLEPQLSRWLWLVKWILGIPHVVVLVFLWIGFVFAGIAAFLAILVTGRYPRALFDYNLGVMRWTWRVSAYAYGVLSTDRYPPFTLKDVPDYPARLEVAYPTELSRGLVLVKWWLLAIPHYLVLALLLGGLSATRGDGVVGILVLIAAVTLLFTGRYPASIFDLVIGIHRWGFRVAAYAGLMTDVYPPFRLDQGGEEPEGEGEVPGDPGARPTGSAMDE